ncbi:hypothetical protein Mapa_016142 [Marchantia paleacea]|nr:hypothetical protein Mapa_016142 [Marchantia paleacea]
MMCVFWIISVGRGADLPYLAMAGTFDMYLTHFGHRIGECLVEGGKGVSEILHKANGSVVVSQLLVNLQKSLISQQILVVAVVKVQNRAPVQLLVCGSITVLRTSPLQNCSVTCIHRGICPPGAAEVVQATGEETALRYSRCMCSCSQPGS